jgi:hypothetical protein
VERIGEFRMTGGGTAITVALEVGQYPSGHTALVAVDAKTGEQLAKLSVDFPEEEMADGEIYLKDYAENERLAQYAIGLGFLEPSDTGLDLVSGFREFRRYRIIG